MLDLDAVSRCVAACAHYRCSWHVVTAVFLATYLCANYEVPPGSSRPTATADRHNVQRRGVYGVAATSTLEGRLRIGGAAEDVLSRILARKRSHSQSSGAGGASSSTTDNQAVLNKQNRASNNHRPSQAATGNRRHQGATGNRRRNQGATGSRRRNQGATGNRRRNQGATGNRRRNQGATGNKRNSGATGNRGSQGATAGGDAQVTHDSQQLFIQGPEGQANSSGRASFGRRWWQGRG